MTSYVADRTTDIYVYLLSHLKFKVNGFLFKNKNKRLHQDDSMCRLHVFSPADDRVQDVLQK